MGHEGTIRKRTSGEFVRVAGTYLTPDHIVYSGAGEAPAIDATKDPKPFVEYRNPNWVDVWQLAGGLLVRFSKVCGALPMFVWGRTRRKRLRSSVR